MDILTQQKWSRLVTCCLVSVSSPTDAEMLIFPVTGTRTLVASPYWAFSLKLIITSSQFLVKKPSVISLFLNYTTMSNITTFEESIYVNQYTYFHYAEVLYIIICMHMGWVGLLFKFNQTNTNP